jgi:hypothetical protein
LDYLIIQFILFWRKLQKHKETPKNPSHLKTGDKEEIGRDTMEPCLPKGTPSDLISVAMTVPWKMERSAETSARGMFTYIRHPGEKPWNAIFNGTINIPPKNVITNLGFFQTVRKEGGNRQRTHLTKAHGQGPKTRVGAGAGGGTGGGAVISKIGLAGRMK